jgi:hypothetical protein
MRSHSPYTTLFVAEVAGRCVLRALVAEGPRLAPNRTDNEPAKQKHGYPPGPGPRRAWLAHHVPGGQPHRLVRACRAHPQGARSPRRVCRSRGSDHRRAHGICAPPTRVKRERAEHRVHRLYDRGCHPRSHSPAVAARDLRQVATRRRGGAWHAIESPHDVIDRSSYGDRIPRGAHLHPPEPLAARYLYPPPSVNVCRGHGGATGVPGGWRMLGCGPCVRVLRIRRWAHGGYHGAPGWLATSFATAAGRRAGANGRAKG